MLQYFIYLLVLVWTLLFGFIFFRLFPDMSDRLTHRQEEIRDGGDVYVREQPCEQGVKERSVPPKQPKPEYEEDTVVPLNREDPPVELKIEGKEEETPTVTDREDVEKRLSSALENRLIQILVKLNLAACQACSKDDKRIILQLKMMKAFLDGKPKEAAKYSEELDKYIKPTKVKDLKDKKKPLKSTPVPRSH